MIDFKRENLTCGHVSLKLKCHLTLIFSLLSGERSMARNMKREKSGFNVISNCMKRDVDRRMRNLIKAPRLKVLLRSCSNYVFVT